MGLKHWRKLAYGHSSEQKAGGGVRRWSRASTGSLYGGRHPIETSVLKNNYGWGGRASIFIGVGPGLASARHYMGCIMAWTLRYAAHVNRYNRFERTSDG